MERRARLCRRRPPRMRHAIEHVEPRRQHSGVTETAADLREDVAHEARSMLEAAAVWPGPRPGAEQFVQQVRVALLDVDEVEADVARERGGIDEAIFQIARARRQR